MGLILPTWETDHLLCYPINNGEKMHCSFQSLAPLQSWNVLQQREEIWKFALRFPRETRLWDQFRGTFTLPARVPLYGSKCLLLLLIRAVRKHPQQSWSCSKHTWQGCGPGSNCKSAALEDLGLLKGGSGRGGILASMRWECF